MQRANPENDWDGSEGWDDGDLSEGLDPEGPSAADLDRFGGETVTCPVCNQETYDQAELCHICGAALVVGSSAPKATFWTVLVGVVIFGLIAILVFG
ncbi:MAG: hypothetical protein AAGB51_05840 [Planctomycetota bacterium]